MVWRNCLILSMNRGIGKFKRGKYDKAKGYYRRWYFLKGEQFGIPEKVKPVALDVSKPFRRNRFIPTFIVNELTDKAIDPYIGEQIDPKLIALLNTFSEVAFYKAMGEQLKMTLGQTLIYLGCGAFIGFVVSEILTKVIH